MKKLYEPTPDYQRVRTFLKPHPRIHVLRLRLSRAAVMALVKSFWLPGIWYRGRVACRKFFWGTLPRRPHHSLPRVGWHAKQRTCCAWQNHP